jgi:hypothetical protein
LKYEALIRAKLHNILHVQARCEYGKIVNNVISLNKMWDITFGWTMTGATFDLKCAYFTKLNTLMDYNK